MQQEIEHVARLPRVAEEAIDVKADSLLPRHDFVKPALIVVQPMPGWKRILDIFVSSLALIVFTPIMLAIALAIKLMTNGPILFTQPRAGLGGRAFEIIKFRTMVVGAEDEQHLYMDGDERKGAAFKMTDDPRVTPIGRFLRKSSLDEFPQFFNVLRGDMSLVGPRPLPLEEAVELAEWHESRLEITPGITCIWQIYARNDPCFDRWARLDKEYARRRSLTLDLKLLLLTVPAVFSCRGAR